MNLELVYDAKTHTFVPDSAASKAKSADETVELGQSMTGMFSKVTHEAIPVAMGGVAALVAAGFIGKTFPNRTANLQGAAIGAGVKGLAAAWALGQGSSWAKVAGYMLLFDAILDVIPLDKIVSGIGGGTTVVSAQQQMSMGQQGGSMNIDQLYSFLKHNA